MRIRSVLLSTALLIVGSAAVAGAAPPVGSCPPAFQGPLTFAQIIEMWPPPPGVDPTAAMSFYDKNGDGSLCIRVMPDALGGGLNAVDNAAKTP